MQPCKPFGVNPATGREQVHKPEIGDGDCDSGFGITYWNGLPRKPNCLKRCSMGLDEDVGRNGYGPCLRRRKDHRLRRRRAKAKILHRFGYSSAATVVIPWYMSEPVVYVRTGGVCQNHWY